MGFYKKHYPEPAVRLAEPGEQESPGVTISAPIEEYLDWLRGHFRRGGRPTHFYDRPFSQFELAVGEALVDGHHEYGARSRTIIVGKHGSVALKHGRRAFGGWAHTKVFFLCDFSTPQGWVPIYSDPEFESILTDEHREQRAADAAERERVLRGAEGMGGGSGDPGVMGWSRRRHGARDTSPSGPMGQDDACLSALAGAEFGPNASLTLPSHATLTSSEAGTWTSLYRGE